MDANKRWPTPHIQDVPGMGKQLTLAQQGLTASPAGNRSYCWNYSTIVKRPEYVGSAMAWKTFRHSPVRADFIGQLRVFSEAPELP